MLGILSLMSTAAELVETEIRQAFPAHRSDEFGPLSIGDREENVRIRADLADVVDWTSIAPEVMAEIDRNSGFGFLTKEAARFYLPAFLVADLQGADLNSDPVSQLCVAHPSTSTEDVITWQLTLLRDHWNALTPAQAAAVCRYLEWRITGPSRGNEGEVAYSLSAYWYQRF